jgi:anti-sigma factor RsiW
MKGRDRNKEVNLMKEQQGHLCDRDLIMALDGELSARDAHRVDTHLKACWTCRSRKTELERAIADFVQLRREEFRIPPSDGPRAMLKARLAEAARSSPTSWWREIDLRIRGWRAAAIFCAALLIYVLAGRFLSDQRHSTVLAAPNPALTPGAAVLETSSEICQEAKPKNKEVDSALRRRVFAEYGIPNAPAQAYEVDYLITPALGGADDIHNLWPHSYGDTEWNATVKDALEDRLHDLVCEGQLDLATAQHEIAGNWIAAYKKYFHTEHPDRLQQ